MTEGNFRIIVSDDEDHVRFMLKTVARTAGLKVVAEAANGQQALDLFRQHQPDLMLLDINMPVKTGDEVLEELLKEFPAARVIVLTSVSDLETVQKCITLGALDYLRKDTPVEEIQKILQEHVAKLRSA